MFLPECSGLKMAFLFVYRLLSDYRLPSTSKTRLDMNHHSLRFDCARGEVVSKKKDYFFFIFLLPGTEFIFKRRDMI